MTWDAKSAVQDALHQAVKQDGYAIAPDAVPEDVLRGLDQALDAGQAGTRNLLSVPAVRNLVASGPVRQLVEPVLGPNAFAVRGIFFNKLPGANWKVPWHQDCVIAVRERNDMPGWGPWSVKDGVPHVRPPAEVLAKMLAIRIHLDNCGGEDGPLRVLPGSYSHGFLKDAEILGWPREAAVTCAVRRGDAILMRPLLLHASSAAAEPANRRVIHIEFANGELPGGMQWHERV